MGKPKEIRENKWISRANNREGAGQPMKKREMNGLVGAKNRRQGGST